MYETCKQPIVEISISAPAYPKEWRTLSDAPNVLYAQGDVSLLDTRKFTVVGSRRTPAPAMKLGVKIAKELSRQFTIVTGTADGGDFAAIEGALAGSGRIICVLACGFSALPQTNIELLREVSQKGLLLSPYPLDAAVYPFSYEYRNKLLAALGEGTLVLSAPEKSGTLITAKYAKGYGKDVFALPYFPGSAAGEGCNALLKKGAILTESAFDIAHRLGINLEEEHNEVTLTADEAKMLAALKDLSDSHVTELAAKSGIPAFKAKAVLSALEVKGKAVALGGNRYAPTR